MLAVLAGAGSGKTRGLINRALAPRAGRVLCTTFTTASRDEIETRLAGRGDVVVSTLHGFAWQIVRQTFPDWGLCTDDMAVSRMTDLVPADTASLLVAESARWQESDLALSSWEPPAGFTLPPHLTAGEARDLMVREWRARIKAQTCTFSDTLALACLILERTIRTPLFDLVLVDEAQDLSPMQARLLGALEDQGSEVVLIGDPEQSIYGFRAGTPAFLQRATPIGELATNFRSSPQVVAGANFFRADGLSQSPAPDAPAGYARVRTFATARDMNEYARSFSGQVLTRTQMEADMCAGRTVHSAKGLEWDHVAVLGVTENSFPCTQATTPALIDEERRLLYVATSRARVGVELLTVAGRESRFLEGWQDHEH